MLKGLCASIVGLALLAPPALAAPMRPSAPCDAPGRLILARDGGALSVLWDALRHGYYACADNRGRRWLGPGSDWDPSHVALAPPYAAMGLRSCERYYGCWSPITLTNLRTARRLTIEVPDAAGRTFGRLVAGRAGFAAWSYHLVDDRGERVGGEVRVLRADGGHEVLAEGPAVDPESLAVAGRRLYWMDGETARSATVDGIGAPAGEVDRRGARHPWAAAPCGRGRLVAAARETAIVDHGGGLRACVRGGRMHPLALQQGDLAQPPEALEPTIGGRFVGWVELRCDGEACVAAPRLMHARTGRRAAPEPLAVGRPLLGAVVVGRRGVMAWGADDRVLLLRIDGTQEVLADADADRSSLALAGDRLYWVRDGVVQTRVVG